MYVTVPGVNANVQAPEFHDLLAMFCVVPNMPLPAFPTATARVAQLNTGPPPDNMLVVLHRWII
jgi:hypothetical protein